MTGIGRFFQNLIGGGQQPSTVEQPLVTTPVEEQPPKTTPTAQDGYTDKQFEQAPDVNLPKSVSSTGANSGATVAQTPQALAAKLEAEELARKVALCEKFLDDRHALDDDPTVEWVEGWHGVRDTNCSQAVPGIMDDQGIFVRKSVSYMPSAAYWHVKRPDPPHTWKNHGAEVHFRIPKVYLEVMGAHVNDPSAGGRFFHEKSPLETPRSKSNKYQEIMPVQVMDVYWVKGDIPDSCQGIGTDMRGVDTWPD
jgi:hypothetical protein